MPRSVSEPLVSSGAAGSGARQESVRRSNLALVLGAVCAADEPPSRAALAEATGMTRSTVSRLVDSLIAGGLVTELASVTAVGPGRPATPLRPGARIAALGLQVNVESLAVRVVDLTGAVVAEATEAGEFLDSEPEPVLAALGSSARRVLHGLPRELRLVGAGLALPGLVSSGSATLLRAPNLGWSDLDVGRALPPHDVGGLALRVGNEASLGALTVALERPGRRASLRDFIYLSGEIGIGGAVVRDSHVMTGRHGWAGELGHVSVDPAGPACRCGSTGCLERYAGREPMLAAIGLPPDAAPAELADRARAGDPDAVGAVASAAWALGVSLASVINVVDVPAVVLGGHLAELGDLVARDLSAHLAQRVISAGWAPPSVHSHPGDAASGALGAALAELERVIADPVAFGA